MCKEDIYIGRRSTLTQAHVQMASGDDGPAIVGARPDRLRVILSAVFSGNIPPEGVSLRVPGAASLVTLATVTPECPTLILSVAEIGSGLLGALDVHNYGNSTCDVTVTDVYLTEPLESI